MSASTLRRDLALALAWTAFVLIMLLGPGAEQSEAAQCKNSDSPGYKLSEREARKATLCLLNRERGSRGLRPLQADRKQQRAASGHNRVMLRKNCFDHQCPGERDLVGRAEAAGYLPCNCSWSVGENIAWGSGGTSSPRMIVAAWMNSPPHRANILSRQFEDAGIAVGDGAPGGPSNSATYTLDFGFKK